jgi:hypothetical protein
MPNRIPTPGIPKPSVRRSTGAQPAAQPFGGSFSNNQDIKSGNMKQGKTFKGTGRAEQMPQSSRSVSNMSKKMS